VKHQNNYEKIKGILSSKFEIELFEAAVANLNDTSNKLRLNNFSYSIRELSRHFLHSLAPSSNVINCVWFKSETKDGLPSRSQRLKYAIQGGLSDRFLREWGFDVDELRENIKSIISSIDTLSQYTHINENHFNISPNEVERESKEVLTRFESFVEMINIYRSELKSFLDGHIEEHMLESLVSNFFENVDCLAPHHSTDYCNVEEYHIIEINDRDITVEVTGTIEVTLEFGSKQERREGDGLDLHESFPFKTTVVYEIGDSFPSDNYTVEDYDVDTSSWYGEN